jgi:hypothetical protein
MRRFPKPRRTHGGSAVPIRVIDFELVVRWRHLGRHREDSGRALNGAQGKDMAVAKQREKQRA